METDMDIYKRNLVVLIERATNSPAKEVDPACIKSIKNLVRSSDSNISASVRFLMDRLNKNHSQVRYLTLLIIDELFSRSKLFRSLWVQSLPRFLLLSVGFRREHPLPPPADRASLLRTKALEKLEFWTRKFGQYYKQLRLGYHYLKNTLRLPFPNPNPNFTRQPDLRADRTQELLRSKFETLRQNFESYKSEIQSTIDEISVCCEILSRKEQEEDVEECEPDEYEYGYASSLSLMRIREEAMNEGENPVENRDNEAVFDVLRELYKLLNTKHMAAIQEWLFVMMRVDLPDNRVTDSILKEVIDLRTVLQSARAKCERLGCKTTAEEDEVIWEEGTMGNSDQPNARPTAASASDLPDDKDQVYQNDRDQSFLHNKGHMQIQARFLDTQAKALQGDSSGGTASIKQKLAQEAPILPWGSYLDAWGSNSAIPANQRGLEIESHWGRVDLDAVIPPEKASEFNVRATYYEDKRHEIQPCRARLRKGGICQRRDLHVCPLHGPIMPRDSNGNLIDEKPDAMVSFKQQDASQIVENCGKGKGTAVVRQMEDIDGLSSQLNSQISEEQTMRLIAARAVDNVRSRDEVTKKRKQADCNAARRAKLTKVREHNDSVLRESAMASTSQGLGEAIGEDLEGWSNHPNKQKRQKQSLSSLLKKKPTAKDRLAQKLLNARVSDATVRQLMKDEHANYKDSFANQW
ncbi:hypothetical protein KI387_026965 [Taxus chinensis]|uniref:UV-stimulated scaffold protein A C-terminal domain-containing protein n=1 Tax=Taxus chinensis TaxID=29808 RepID=A0AA38L8K4_TAXCH|nr:hypothetical protein KI387_026965 [Taxus chinensis]